MTVGHQLLHGGLQIMTVGHQLLCGGLQIMTVGHQLLRGGLQIMTVGHQLLCGGLQIMTVGHQLLCGGLQLTAVKSYITLTPHARHGASNHQWIECLFNSLFRLTSKKPSKPALLIFYEMNPPLTSRFVSLRASMALRVWMLWRHHVIIGVIQLWTFGHQSITPGQIQNLVELL